jgi:hypothetical protein
MVKPHGLLGTTFLVPLAETFQHLGATLVTLDMPHVAALAQKTIGATGGNYELFLALLGQDLKNTPAEVALSYGGNQFLEETPTGAVRNFLADLGVPQLAFFTRGVEKLVPFMRGAAAARANWSCTSLVANSPDLLPADTAEPRSFYLPPGTNPRLFHPLDDRPEATADAVFVGSFTIWRATVLAHLAETLPLKVYGDWRFKLFGGLEACWHEPVDYFSAVNGVYAAARCVLDVPVEPGLERISVRVFDALAGGNPAVAPRSGLLDACLAEGAEYIGYAPVDPDNNKLAVAYAALNQRMREGSVIALEAIAQDFSALANAAEAQAQKIAAAVRRLLDGPSPRAVADAGRECVMAQHLWEHRIPRLLDIALGGEPVAEDASRIMGAAR